MTYRTFYEYAWKLLENQTPLPADCGQLCDAACCRGDEETGMYLFPGERVMYQDMPLWAKVEPSAFEYTDGVFADLLLCEPWCDRGRRPLACRIFPLLPYVRDGKMAVMMDPRGRAMCPLAKVIRKSELDDDFVRRVEYIGALMMKIPKMRLFLEELSLLIDEQLVL